MGYWLCLLFGLSAACSAGGATIGFPCEVQNEHSDIGMDSHIERSFATPYGQARLGSFGVSGYYAERRWRAERRECTGRQHGTAPCRVLGRQGVLRTISIYRLRGESREQMRLLYMNAAAIRVWEDGESAQDNWRANSAASHSSPRTRRSLWQLDTADRSSSFFLAYPKQRHIVGRMVAASFRLDSDQSEALLRVQA